MSFDWQAELAAPRGLSSAATGPSPPPKLVNMISFAQVLTALHTVSSNDSLSLPSITGESVSIKISQALYEKGMAVCKRNLCGRLVLNKGDKPYATKDIHLKLQKQWKTIGAWSMLSLGKGFYEFTFASETDLRTVWAAGKVNLKPGVLQLFQWTKDFNLHTTKHSCSDMDPINGTATRILDG
jgi:hypothetical protein